jgi:hypothetical protein
MKGKETIYSANACKVNGSEKLQCFHSLATNTLMLLISITKINSDMPSSSLHIMRNTFQSPPSNLGGGLQQSSSSPAELVLVLG